MEDELLSGGNSSVVLRAGETVHDASVPLVGQDLVWSMPRHEPAEVICHNDAAPYNMTFIDGRIAGLFDFDTAAPGPRVRDLAYLAYRLAPLAEDSGVDTSEQERLARIDLLVQRLNTQRRVQRAEDKHTDRHDRYAPRRLRRRTVQRRRVHGSADARPERHRGKHQMSVARLAPW